LSLPITHPDAEKGSRTGREDGHLQIKSSRVWAVMIGAEPSR
jgi:hypothetical protein